MTDTPIYNPTLQHRRSIRLRDYDYSQAGAYFITICTQNRECLFGGIGNGAMELNGAGRMVQNVWEEIPIHYQDIETEEFVVMPNHIHGIIMIVGAGHHGCPIEPVGAGPVPARMFPVPAPHQGGHGGPPLR